MQSKLVSVVLSVGVLATISPAVARGQTTDVTISSVKVVQGSPQKGSNTITATGTVTLAQGDTLDSCTFWFTDPSGKNPIITYKPPFVPPAPGKSSNFSCVVISSATGNWSFSALITYDGGAKSKQANETFNVPPQ